MKRFLNYWNILLFLAILVFLLQHIILGSLHFHECDSSSLYEWMKNSSFEEMNTHINIVTPNFLNDLRIGAAEISQSIKFTPIQKFFQLPFLSTYSPLMGLIFGSVRADSFDEFYKVGSFINGLALLSSSLFIYLTCLKLNYSKFIRLFCSVIILTLYSTNSYSFHLGSTIWYFFSISCGIYLITFKNSFLKDISNAILLMLSYPYILWAFCLIFIDSIILIYPITNIKSSLKTLILDLITKKPLTIISLFLNIILFFPFDSGYRYGPDLRGLYSIFSFFPLNNNNHILSILLALSVYLLCIYSFLKTFNFIRNKKFELFKTQFNYKVNLKKEVQNNRYKVNVYCIFFLLVFIGMVLSLKMTFSTTRHSIFIIPPLLIVASYGLEEFISFFRNRNILGRNSMYLFIIFAISFMTFSSINSSLERVDILKQKDLPNNIVNFVKNNENIKYSIIGCSHHLSYSDFSKKKFEYDLEDKNNLVDLYALGKKLVISQRPTEYNDEFTNYLLNNKPKVNDEIKVLSKDVKIKIISKPYISKKHIYFDSLNQSSKIYNLQHTLMGFAKSTIVKYFPLKEKLINEKITKYYNWYNFFSKTGEEYPYARPNDIWLIPINVERI